MSVPIFVVASLVFTSGISSAKDNAEYRQFTLGKVSCDAAVSYKTTKDGLEVKVAAVAYGKGSEFRKWDVTDIRLHIGREAITTENSSRFFVKKESVFRYPAAVVFAALGTQASAAGSGFNKAVTATGATIGFGLLALMAEGDITGERDIFTLSWDTADKITEPGDCILITVEDTDEHLKETVRIALMKAPPEEPRFDFTHMRQDELLQIMDTLGAQINTIRNNQSKYKRGADKEYDEMQGRIEALETERAHAYKTWFERGRKTSSRVLH